LKEKGTHKICDNVIEEIIKILKIKELGRVTEEIQNFHIVQVNCAVGSVSI
jgi:hypothetical protein